MEPPADPTLPASAPPPTTPTDPPQRPWSILGRLTAAVREQNWFAVGIELAIVVLGVFLGIQLGNWNSDRAAQRMGEAYAERLVADLERDRGTRQRLVGYYDAVAESAGRTVDLLGDPSADPRDLVIHAYRATEYAYDAQTRATWDEVVSSGNVGLLPQGAVEAGLSDYFSIDVARYVLDRLEESPYRRRVRSLLPHEVQEAIRSRCGDVRDEAGAVVGFQSDCDIDADEGVIRDAARRLRETPAVAEGLRYQFSTLAGARANLRGDLVYIDRAIAALEGRDPGDGRAP